MEGILDGGKGVGYQEANEESGFQSLTSLLFSLW